MTENMKRTLQQKFYEHTVEDMPEALKMVQSTWKKIFSFEQQDFETEKANYFKPSKFMDMVNATKG